MTDEARIREIEARCEAATSGPWEVHDYNRGDDRRDPWLGVIRGAFEILDERFQVGRVKYSALPSSENIANAAFIAHAREDVPFLLAALRERDRRIEELTKRADEGFAAHAHSFGALASIALLLNQDGVDDYQDVVRGVEDVVNRAASLPEQSQTT